VNVSADGDLDEAELLSIVVSLENVDDVFGDGEIRVNGDSDAQVTIEEYIEDLLAVRSGVGTDGDDNLRLVWEDGFDESDLNVNAVDDDTITSYDELLNTDANRFRALPYAASAEDADERIVFVSIRDREVDVSFVDIDDGDYEFSFDVDDTEASATASISVRDGDVSIEFDRAVYTQSAGDVVRVVVELEDADEALIQFGSEESGFIDILYVEDDTGNDEVEFYVNTRTIGTGAADVVYSPDDIVASFIDSEFDFDDFELQPRFIDGDSLSDGEFDSTDPEASFAGYLDELDLLSNANQHPTQQIVRPIQPADYDLAATSNDVFYAEDGESDLEDEDGFAVIDLVVPELGETTVWVGPTADADDADAIADLIADSPLSEADGTIALDDLLVARIEASGLYGHMVAIEGSFEPVTGEGEGFSAGTLYELTETREGEGISFTFEDTDTVGNQDANALRLEDADDGDVFVLVDNEAGEIYVIVDTSSSDSFDRTLREGATFEIELAYGTDDDDRFRFASGDDGAGNDRFADSVPRLGPLGGADGDIDEAAYPYFRAGQSAATAATVTFEPRSAAFENTADGVVRLSPTGDAVVSGDDHRRPRLRRTASGPPARRHRELPADAQRRHRLRRLLRGDVRLQRPHGGRRSARDLPRRRHRDHPTERSLRRRRRSRADAGGNADRDARRHAGGDAR